MKNMNKLQSLIFQATKLAGSYNPTQSLPFIEEQLTPEEYRQAEQFLKWVVKTKTTFGWNLPEVWNRWKKGNTDGQKS